MIQTYALHGLLGTHYILASITAPTNLSKKHTLPRSAPSTRAPRLCQKPCCCTIPTRSANRFDWVAAGRWRGEPTHNQTTTWSPLWIQNKNHQLQNFDLNRNRGALSCQVFLSTTKKFQSSFCCHWSIVWKRCMHFQAGHQTFDLENTEASPKGICHWLPSPAPIQGERHGMNQAIWVLAPSQVLAANGFPQAHPRMGFWSCLVQWCPSSWLASTCLPNW